MIEKHTPFSEDRIVRGVQQKDTRVQQSGANKVSLHENHNDGSLDGTVRCCVLMSYSEPEACEYLQLLELH